MLKGQYVDGAAYQSAGGNLQELVELWEICDRQNPDPSPLSVKSFKAPNRAIAQRIVKSLLQTPDGKFSYAVSPDDFFAQFVSLVHPVCPVLVSNEHTPAIIEFKDCL